MLRRDYQERLSKILRLKPARGLSLIEKAMRELARRHQSVDRGYKLDRKSEGLQKLTYFDGRGQIPFDRHIPVGHSSTYQQDALFPQSL